MLNAVGYGNQWEYYPFWNNVDPTQNHVVQFNGETKTIWILNGITEVLVKEHLYSDWKEWIAIYDHTKYEQAFETEGGRPISATERLGDSYLLINDWVIRQKDSSTPVNIIGNLYAYDENDVPKDPYENAPDGGRSISSTVTNIVTTVTVPTPAKGLTEEQEWILKLAYEESRRARAMQTNKVAITKVGSGAGAVDTINVYDDDGITLLYTITVTGEDADNRDVTYVKDLPAPPNDLVDGRNVYCPLPTIPDDPCA